MNAKCYRTVFNAARGMLVAVEESAKSTGKGRSAGASARGVAGGAFSTFSRFTVLPLAFGAWCAFGIPAAVNAQVVAAPGSGAQVVQTQNGLQQVNVGRPNGAGVSINTYSQFNVPSQGTILNNAAAITQTQQAGYINGNPNLLPGGSARIIVNQVTSTNASTLNGYLEVAGPRTEVIIANPNGILVNGGGFINTSRATLTTGVPVFGGAGSLDAFRVTGGQISIQGAGLNAVNVDQVDLIARAVQANAAVYANQLNVIAGANQVDRNTLAATPIAGDGAAPAVGIDVSALGGMYANKILLASTENGVGVSLKGVMAAQAGDLTLTSAGQLILAGTTSATGNLNASARGDLTNSGATYGGGAVSVSSDGTFTNSGALASQQGLNVNGGTVNSTGSWGAGVAQNGTVTQAADLNVTASGALSATGTNAAGGNATFQGNGVSLAHSQTSANGNLALNSSSNVDLTGAATHAGGAVTTTVAGAFVNDAGHLTASGPVQVTAGSVSNAGGQIESQRAVGVQSTGAVNNTQGTVQAGGALSVSGSTIDNTAGRLVSLNSDGLTVNATTAITNVAGTTNDGAQGGVIGGNGAATLTTGNLVNHGQISAAKNATLNTSALDNSNGSVSAGQTLTATVTGAVNNQHGTLSADTTQLNAGSVDNTSGKIDGNQLALTTTGNLSNQGGTINQYGQVDTTLQVGGTLDNTNGSIAANAQNLAVNAQAITNDSGKLLHAGTGTLALTSSGALSNVGGQIQTNGNLTTQSASLNNTQGSASAQGATSITTTGDLVNKQGSLYGQAGLTLASGGQLDNTHGSAQTSGNLSATAAGAVQNANGVIAANGAHGTMGLSAASVSNAAGRLVNAGDGATTVTATTSLQNDGGALGGNGDVTLNSQTLSNTANGTIAAAGALALNTSNAVNNSGGLIYGAQDLTLNQAGATLTNNGGSVQGGQDAKINVASMSNGGGNVRANRDVSVQGGMSGDGEMTAGRNLTLQVAGDYTNGANNHLRADGNMSLSATGTLINSATLGAAGNTTVQAGNVVNTATGDITGTNTAVSATNTITNAGRIEGDTVQTTSATLANTGTLIGRTVQTQANDISNSGAAALIAAAQDLKIYANNSVSNLDGATIYSGGNLQIAKDGTRDPNTGMLVHQVGTLTNRSADIEADGDIDIAAKVVNNTRTSIVTAPGAQQTASQTLTTWYAGFTGSDLNSHRSLTFPTWSWDGQGAPISASLTYALMQPITVTVPKSTVTGLNTTNQTLSFSTSPTEQYINPPEYNQCGREDPQCRLDATHTRNLTSNPTQYYQSITDNGSTYSITFWPDWDPSKNLRPDQVRVRLDLGIDSRDYNETQRTTTTTTSTDQLVSASDPAKIRASGNIRINSDGGTILNQSSIMAAGSNLVRSAAGGTVTDQGTALQQSTTTTETSTFYWHQKTGGEQDTQVVPYPTTPVASTTVMALPAIASSNQTVQTNAQTINVTTVNRVGETVTGSGVTGGGATGSQVAGASGQTSHPQTLGTASGGIPNLTLPINGLFRFQTAPGATYLVATDPRFTQYTKFISSDYMLGQLGLNPQTTEKRLGDGFYEEKLVRDQITQLTGRTFLAGYSDQLTEYQALMDNGVKYAKAFSLSPGIGLSDAQMAQLTTDMVWLVSQDVTLPDGSHQTVLVPKLYLAQANTVDLNSTGALVTGNNVNLNATGDVSNSGRIVGNVATQVLGNNIVNQGTIGGAGSTTAVQALQDVRNIGGTITGQDVGVFAGRDVINSTQTISNLNTVGPNNYTAGATGIGSVGTIAATNNATVAAGRDITMQGGAVGAGNTAVLAAGRDVNLGAIQTGTMQDAVSRGGQSYSHDQTTTNVGSTVAAGQNAVVVAGRDATLTSSTVQAGNNASVVAARNVTETAALATHAHSEGSLGGTSQYTKSSYDETANGSTIRAGNNATLGAGQTATVNQALQNLGMAPVADQGPGNVAVLGSAVSTDKGTAKLVATGDVTVGTVNERHTSDHWSEDKHSGFLSSTQTTSIDSTKRTDVVGSTVSADSVAVSAGQDINVKGSSVAATNDAMLVAKRDINIESATASSSESHFREEKTSGLMGSGGIGFTVGSRKQSEDDRNIQTSAVASTVGSTNGNVTLSAGNHYQQTGSNVIALQGDVDIAAKKVDIIEARETSHASQETKFEQSGLTVAVTAPVIAALQTASQMGSAASQTSDTRLKLLAGGATALAGKNAADAVAADPKSGGGASISITVGGSKSESKQTQDSDSAVGSTVKAGGNVSIRATGDGKNSTLTVQGSDIQAGKDALLKADGDINLLAAKSTADMQRDSSSISGGVGVAVSVSSNGASFGVTANASASRGEGNGHDVTWTNTHVNAGNQLKLESGGDTNLKGAVASGKQVVADVGGNLNMESLQDTSTFHSKDQSIAGSVTVGYGFSGSASASQQKIDSDYASVTEQSGIKAGDGGFQVNVKGNTDLKGAVIASTDKAVQEGTNSLTTGTLTTSEIHNHADYSASSIGIGGGYSSGGNGVGTNQKGEATAGGDKVPGTTLPSSGGFSAAPPIVMGASGSGSSTTVSGISGGTVNITDNAKQQALTGKDADQTVASVNRNVSTEVDTSGALKPIFNEKEIKTGFEITGAFISQAGTFLNNRAQESTQAQKALDAEKAKPADQQDPAKIAQLTQTLQDNATWGMGGTGRMLLTALTAGAGGNVTGGMGQLAQNATIAYLQELGAQQVKKIADSLGSEDARAALHAVVGCAGAAASSQSCGAGAMGAAASSVIGSLLGPTDGMSASDKQSRENLVNSLVAGIAASAGVNAATATNAGQIEAENNQLLWGAAQPRPLPPSPGQPQKPFQIPGFKGDSAKKGDGVISDPVQQLDPTANVHANPISEPTGPKILVSPIDIIKSGFEYLIASVKGGNQASDSAGAPPPNMSPDGAGRQGAFNEAKRQSGIPVSQQPSAVYPNTDRRGNVQPGYQYEYTVPVEGGGTRTVIIRDDANGHFFGEANPQNRGPHFNDPAGNHYDY